MLWIIGAVSSILFGILIALLTKRACSCAPNTALSIIFILIGVVSNMVATTRNLDKWSKITWSSHTALQQAETLISVNRILRDDCYDCYVKTSSGELKEQTYSNQDIKIMDNTCSTGRIEIREVSGTVIPDEWWNSFAYGTRKKEIYYIYAPDNKINVIDQYS